MKKDNRYVEPNMSISRITAKGQITNLSNGFELKGGAFFSIYVRPKTLTTLERDAIISCQLYGDNQCSDVPVPLFAWCELCITKIAPSSTLLNSYDIYWGAGIVDYRTN